jgi:hypothetical protein
MILSRRASPTSHFRRPVSFLLAVATVVFAERSSVARAEPAAASERPQIRWVEDCRFDPATFRICTSSTAPGVPRLQPFHTVMAKLPGRNEQRVQVSSAPDARWILLARSPETHLCFKKRKENIACEELGFPFPSTACTSDTFQSAAACEFRVVPFDNPSFPDFPDPRARSSYFSPPAVYQDFGDTSGDVDELFWQLTLGPRPHENGLSPAAQRLIEIFAWQWFVHLNWPADLSGRIRLDWHRKHVCPVWATWRPTSQVMVPPGSSPLPWGAPGADGRRLCSQPPQLSQTSATGDAPPLVGDAKHQQPDGEILWDRDGAPILYETRINRPLFESVVSLALHTERGLRRGYGWPRRLVPRSFAYGKFFFAGGDNFQLHGIAKSPPPFSEGAIAIKLAWKILTRAQRASQKDERRFVTARATVTEEARAKVRGAIASAAAAAAPQSEGADSIEKRFLKRLPWEAKRLEKSPDLAGLTAGESSRGDDDLSCDGDECDVALVGMHIATKPGTQQLWSWATFAHRDNLSGAPSLLATENCPNLPPNESRTACDPRTGRCVTHVCPTVKPSAATRGLNEQVRAMLANTPADHPLHALANYDLLGMQWVDDGGGGTGAGDATVTAGMGELSGRAHPARMTNPVFETFDLDGSCFGCHENARYKLDETHSPRTDMMFFLTQPSRSPGPVPPEPGE